MADTSKEWIRTHYDKNGDCHIDQDEAGASIQDYHAGIITKEQADAVIAAYDNNTNLCAGSKTPPCGNYGDVDDDGVVDSSDYQMIADYVVGKITLTPDQLTRADVTGDGNVTMADALWVQRYIDGDVNTFPVCGGTVTDVCSWITGKGGCDALAAFDIMTLVKGYIGKESLGFTVTASHISGAVAYYLGQKASGNTLTGCNF